MKNRESGGGNAWNRLFSHVPHKRRVCFRHCSQSRVWLSVFGRWAVWIDCRVHRAEQRPWIHRTNTRRSLTWTQTGPVGRYTDFAPQSWRVKGCSVSNPATSDICVVTFSKSTKVLGCSVKTARVFEGTKYLFLFKPLDRINLLPPALGFCN